MEQRIETELAEHQRQASAKTRRKWPDDGLPARHKVVRPSPHHPAALIAQLFWR